MTVMLKRKKGEEGTKGKCGGKQETGRLIVWTRDGEVDKMVES